MAAQAQAGSAFQRFLNHPAGPKTIHFWAPTMKWGLVIAGLSDINRPVEQLSVMQTTALTATGVIWSRYSLVIKPVNYSLFAVNVFLGATGIYQMGRLWKHQQELKEKPVTTKATDALEVGKAKVVELKDSLVHK
ncbi:Mitochondrial pyruvate carrier 2 [Thoreauomyces humboldtii]|nr:Mitochondrial pyruvate carrier 2 [Thoreauomyces humboldtii]